MQAAAAQASELMRAIGNDSRLMILCHLAQGEKTVGELQALIGLTQSALSQHLARLRRSNLVATRRQAQTIHYRIASSQASRVIEALYDIYCAPPVEA